MSSSQNRCYGQARITRRGSHHVSLMSITGQKSITCGLTSFQPSTSSLQRAFSSSSSQERSRTGPSRFCIGFSETDKLVLRTLFGVGHFLKEVEDGRVGVAKELWTRTGVGSLFVSGLLRVCGLIERER